MPTKEERIKLTNKFNQLEARIKYTDDKINLLVFYLYGLNEEERGIVEGGIRKTYKVSETL